jgi:double-stranded uracil-DNA glycosylase
MNRQPSIATRCNSFPPIAAVDSRVLVLGSMPSVASLAKQQYYGHPHNSFWPIMGQLFEAGPELPYDDRRRILCNRGVAVWDVLQECVRRGSLDASIRKNSEVPNDFPTFLRRHPEIGAIFFNGQKAETAFRRHALADVARLDREFCYLRLPSTSPAHAGRTFNEKLAAWRAVKEPITRSAPKPSAAFARRFRRPSIRAPRPT